MEEDAIKSRVFSANYLLVDPNHPLRWNISTDHDILALYTDRKPPESRHSSRGVAVYSWQQGSGTWVLAFVLADSAFKEMFEAFCKDVVESSRTQNSDRGPAFAYSRFYYWIRMWSPDRAVLPVTSVQGLLGELVVIRDLLIPRYGVDAAIESWMNRKSGKQDFMLSDKWMEVKSILEGDHAVTISSFEQLDRDDVGNLVTVTMRKSSKESPRHMTLNSVSDELEQMILHSSTLDLYMETLDARGYSHQAAYDDICYEFLCGAEYEVRAGFPRIRASMLPEGIMKGEYDLGLDSLTEYEVGRWS